MSSIQYGLPIATNRVLTAIDDFRRVSENEFDYYVEPIIVNIGEDSYEQEYRVYINYFNGVTVFGTLSSWNDTQSVYEPIRGELIESYTELFYGKLFRLGEPFYVVIPENTSSEYIELMAHRSISFYVIPATKSYGSTSYRQLKRYTYNCSNKTVTINEDQEDIPPKIYTTIFVQSSYINENGVVENDIFYLSEIPNKRTGTIVCYKYGRYV